MTPTDLSSDSNDEIRIERRYDTETPPSVAIVQAIAALEDVNPTEFQTDLGIRLYDQLDPEALDRLVADADSNVVVDLRIQDDHEYAIELRDDGHLVVQKGGLRVDPERPAL